MGSVGAAMPVTPADSNAASEMETDDKTTPIIPDSYWAKYNVKVEKPQYTNEQYETHLKSEDWSREETDYLVDLAYDFDLRWIIIADRYVYHPNEAPKENADTMAATAQAKPRTQEDMKARYYNVAAKAMVLHNPLSSMSSSEFDAHEKMTKYNPHRETQRKKYAEQLMQRTDEEKYEEEMLLKELSRIVNNQEKLFNDRRALYDRLEHATTTTRDNFSSTGMYHSSQGLTQLVQSLIAQSKSQQDFGRKEKRRSALEAGEVPGGYERGNRHSLSGPDKRASFGAESSNRRQLSAREEAKWGISHPNERLTGGVQFRHERVTKAGQAKSGVQTSRIGAALTELGVAPRLFMPTAKVVTEYENLIEKIKTLLEARKVSEKLDAEIKIWKQHTEQQEAKDRGEEVKEEDQGSQKEGLNEDEDEEEEASRVEAAQQETSKVEEEDEDDDNDNGDQASEAEEDDDEEQGETKNDDSEAEAEVEDQEEGDESNDDSSDGDENETATEVQNLQPDGDEEDEDEDVDAQDQQSEVAEPNSQNVPKDNNDDEESAEDQAEEAEPEPEPEPEPDAAPSPAPTTKSEGPRKRSASVISHVSNRSSKRQRK